ncbi:MAG: ATP-binding protein [Solirubrobacterales bacterium]|nr:ATP-binding protein [Solirubrobacterales bacterium]
MLVGRKTERARIDALLAGAREGRGGALVLRGEPGIGKSALLADARSRAADMRVLHAHGVQAEAVLVYSGLHELLRPVADRLDALPDLRADAVRGALGLGPGQSTPLLVGAGTLSLLVAAAEERPLLCLVDDAHWLDAASAGALTFAARRLEDDPVAVLFAAREGESRAFAAGGIPEFALAGLESEDAAEMLRGRGVEGKVAVELQRVAVGNPLALLELPRALSEAQRRGEGELPQPLAVTEALQAAFAGRIERLPAATRLVLLVAAAESSGRLGPIERACAIVGADAGALAAAEDAHLVGVARDRLRLQWLGFMAEVDPPRAVAGLLDEARRTGVDAVHAASAGAVAASIASRAGDARSAVEASRLIAGAGAPDDPFRSLTEAIGALSGGLVDYSEALTGPALELAQWEEWRRERPEDWLPMFTVSLGIETLLMLGEHEVVRDRAESALARVDPADLLLWTVAGFYLGVAELYGGRWAGARARLGEMVRMGAEGRASPPRPLRARSAGAARGRARPRAGRSRSRRRRGPGRRRRRRRRGRWSRAAGAGSGRV